ncbi:MAG: hydrogenase maturation peptidase HycI [Minisyncoccota bacterium]
MSNLNLKKILKKSLDGSSKVAVLGVGSELRADDAAGTLVARAVEEYCRKNGAGSSVRVFFGETAPENLTGEIKKFEPSHLIILDAADTSEEPGTIKIITPEEINGISFSTHQMPLYVLVDYLKESLKCSILIIGIQPGVLQFGKPVSREVKQSVQQVAKALSETLKARCLPG